MRDESWALEVRIIKNVFHITFLFKGDNAVDAVHHVRPVGTRVLRIYNLFTHSRRFYYLRISCHIMPFHSSVFSFT